MCLVCVCVCVCVRVRVHNRGEASSLHQDSGKASRRNTLSNCDRL